MRSQRIRALTSLPGTIYTPCPNPQGCCFDYVRAVTAAVYGKAFASQSSLVTLTVKKKEWEGEAWPTYTDREKETVQICWNQKNINIRNGAEIWTKIVWLSKWKRGQKIGREAMLSGSIKASSKCFLDNHLPLLVTFKAEQQKKRKWWAE